ncbi:major facilitator superfamily domain-containing protein [Biscogniauxia sp. FL1348]|nr:major facilitator superfamily domain-containing protein [Biscogniauxia sp. FL1348]
MPSRANAEKHQATGTGSGTTESADVNREGVDIDARRTTRKIDWRLVPLLQLLYALTFLDRVNVGNARLWHLERDLGMTGFDYNIVVLVFYIPYIVLEIPSLYIFNRVEPRKFLGTIIMGWGLTRTYAHLVAARVALGALGALEAGMLPACAALLGSRMALLFVANDVAWRYVPPFPDAGGGGGDGGAAFLTAPERAWLLAQLARDNEGRGVRGRRCATGNRTILAMFGWGSLRSNLLSAPFVLAGFGLSVLGLLLVMLLRASVPRYPLVMSWCINQATSSTKRGITAAFAATVGQLGGIISALVFPSQDSPQYVNGILVCIVLQVAAVAAAAVNMWACCAWENRQRRLGKKDHLRQLSEEEQVKLEELHPDFRYTL